MSENEQEAQLRDLVQQFEARIDQDLERDDGGPENEATLTRYLDYLTYAQASSVRFALDQVQQHRLAEVRRRLVRARPSRSSEANPGRN
ncbi:MAG TPA: hypothetical protein VK455_03965 [Thermoplasmata archaeon]|nr:hypothetical protein [Thermoplasmata archaeon]